jgi:4-amino-4-deoxy-L-arabinose transferase-like glycosyltransferase
MIVINPFREMLSEDDGWAYARTVQRLLATGHYQLDSWSAANMPVQIYLAAGLAKLGGYSLSLLRCTTLALLVVGLGSFYALLRELGYTRSAASVVTLAIPASPLVLMLAFTFMSDVQFLGWLLLSLWLYVRGMRHQSAGTMLLGSLAAGCAIGTRQFGIAIIGGLIVSWLLSRRESRRPTRLMLAGLLIPLVAAGAQFYIGLKVPNFTQTLPAFRTPHLLQPTGFGAAA